MPAASQIADPAIPGMPATAGLPPIPTRPAGQPPPACPIQPTGRASPWDLFAGVLTALAFYAEYISLGSNLGENLAGAGQAKAALGAMLVIGAVLACCIGALFGPQPLLAGPRAASLLVLGAGLAYATEHAADLSMAVQTDTLAVALMLCVSAGV
ncbi:MAG: SulP family inorganic anion transporter, partial [Rhodoferax sp.]|nr:SulP family inorganic anion transporter [Rhodoferax sp.]